MAYTQITNSTTFFESIKYTGNGGTQNITGINFKPDFLWIKDRTNANDHKLQDSIRGSTYTLESNEDTDEYNDTNAITSFNNDGFTTGANGNTNTNSATYSGWVWNTGANASITYTVKVVSDGGNKYRFDDFGTSAVTLSLEEGGTYTFDGSDSSMASHPILLSETNNGTHGGGSVYNTGVTYLLDGSSVTQSAYVSGYSSATTRKLQITVAASAPTLYYFCHYHSGMGGQANTTSTKGSSNFKGTIQSTVSASATAGFSIVTYTGTGSNATVGHGLGIIPDLVWIKKRSGGTDAGWLGYHAGLGTNTGMRLDHTSNNLSGSDLFNGTAPTANTFSIGTNFRCNEDNSSTYVAYCYSSIKGFSSVGTLQGTGISGNGPYVNCGFKPSFLVVKNNPDSNSWRMYDDRNPGYNKNGYYVNANAGGNESTNNTATRIDFMSNGFKIVGDSGSINGDGDTMVYWAYAQNPFVGGGIPATAF